MAKEKNEVLEKPKEETQSQITPAPVLAPIKTQLKAAGDKTTGDGSSDSFVDQFYNKINDVLGGRNPNQFLCLTIPGQALSAEDFRYDYKNNAPKGPVVEANESRLANKLFDPCKMTGADNGLTLPYQYRTALDMLTPKLNAKVAEAKNQLRELLMTEYPYDFGDGDEKKYTLQEVFFRLYDEWVAESEKWSEVQNAKKEELKKKYPGTDADSNMKYNDAYLEWYETVAESYLNVINEKMSKVISVFTPNDMKILEGILDSGSGAELQEARQTLTNVQKLNPDGGYVYPVKFNPTNWFEHLNTSFTPLDLLKTPDSLAMQLQSLSSRRMKISARIADISSMIPDSSSLSELQNAVSTAKGNIDNKTKDLIGKYGDGISTILNTVLDIAPLFSGGVPADIIAKLASGVQLKSGETVESLISALKSGLSEAAAAQQAYVNASQQLADASEKAIEAKNISGLKNVVAPLKEQLDELNMQIQEVQTQIQLSSISRPVPGDDGTVKDTDTDESAVTPSSVPEGYMQIVISATASQLDNATSSSSIANVSTSGANFWFGGYHAESSDSASSFSSLTDNDDITVRIGMNVAKVSIEREWFNPGVFALTKDMFNVTSLKISPNPSAPYTSMTDERISEMATGGSVFPCYPVAMVIARDISIKLVSSKSISSEFVHSMEQHASSGGGFLFFSGASSSSSSSSVSGVHATSTDNTITLRFDTPQILGYYLEATAADKSSYLGDVSGDAQAGYVTISEFVADYKKMLEAMKEKKTEL